MINEVGDLVYWEINPNKKFTIECISVEMNGWIWSSEFDIPYCRDGSKNFHKPISHSLGKLINISKIRDVKLKELGI
jgi:hypothetical protein